MSSKVVSGGEFNRRDHLWEPGTVMDVACKWGPTNGSVRLTCLDNGIWSRSPPPCQGET